ncbi:MAG: VWA domain-containing protein [Lachnospiraceae bacterium]|nr:VWA domain-containing protein [Lachnospiraceae bacterium]
MERSNITGKKAGSFIIVVAIFFIVIFTGISLISKFSGSGSGGKIESEEEAQKQLTKLLDKVKITEVDPVRGQVEFGATSLADELPDISKYDYTVVGNGEINVEIISSPEKAGDGTDGWMNEMAEEFNRSGYTYDGKSVSVSVRNITSGLAMDYIVSGKYVPEGFSPSANMWGEMTIAQGSDLEVITDRTVGNVAGILLKKSKIESLEEKYGSVDMKTVTQAVADGELLMGYTNPLASSTGLNFLLCTLYAYDSENVLSDTAIDGFTTFQQNIPYVAYNTMQMRESASSGSLEGMILEYQTYVNSDLQSTYDFIPFGLRHDNPLYATESATASEKAVLTMFAEFCSSDAGKSLADEYGFNGLDSYVSELPDYSGTTIVNAQKLWKENKDYGKEIIAVFVADVSGSMSGDPMNQLKDALVISSQYINENNSIGLVSYSSDVYINLPIGKFDLNQRSYFVGAVDSLMANGNTASYDALLVAVDMIEKELENNPDATPMIFLLSDGETNVGNSLKSCIPILQYYSIPVYTIGYNANIEALEEISSINEAVSINADSDDVIYKIKSLFNAQM